MKLALYAKGSLVPFIILLMIGSMIHGQLLFLFYAGSVVERGLPYEMIDASEMNLEMVQENEGRRHICPRQRKTANDLCEYFCSISVWSVLGVMQMIPAPFNLTIVIKPKFDRCPNSPSHLSDPPPPRSSIPV